MSHRRHIQHLPLVLVSIAVTILVLEILTRLQP